MSSLWSHDSSSSSSSDCCRIKLPSHFSNLLPLTSSTGPHSGSKSVRAGGGWEGAGGSRSCPFYNTSPNRQRAKTVTTSVWSLSVCLSLCFLRPQPPGHKSTRSVWSLVLHVGLHRRDSRRKRVHWRAGNVKRLTKQTRPRCTSGGHDNLPFWI